MKRLFYLAIVIVVLYSSCKNTAYTFKAKYNDTSSSKIIETGVIQTPVLADLEVETTKVTGNFTGDSVTMEYAKNRALSDAINKANADILIEPNYDIEIENNTITVTVKGFPAKYKNFRKAEPKDTFINDFNQRSYSSVVLKQEKPYTNNLNISTLKCDEYLNQGRVIKTTGSIFLGLGGAATILGLLSINGNNGLGQDGAVPLIAVGSVFTLTGTVMIPIGVSLKKKGQTCKKNLAF